jgi:mannose-1-phosphate guanylyltransferase
MKAIILVGGQGTRLRPLTYQIPKNIVPLCGVPFLTYQFEFLKTAGITDVILALGYQPHKIKKLYGNGENQKLQLHYSLEKKPLGTAGAIKKAKQWVGKHTLVILNGDILTQLPLTSMIQFHQKNKAMVTIGLVAVKDPTAYGLVFLNRQKKIIRFLEKPTLDQITTNTINTGVYIFEPSVLDFIPDNENYSVERELFPNLLSLDKALYGFVTHQYWQDIGTPFRYLTTQWDILDGKFPMLGKYKKMKKNIYVEPHVQIDPSAQLAGPLIIGSGTTIGKHAIIAPYSVIGKQCTIADGSVISKSILLNQVHVDSQIRLEHVIAGNQTRFKETLEANSGVIMANQQKEYFNIPKHGYDS